MYRVFFYTGDSTLTLAGSLNDGETDKVARQHDATQTQEAAPLPPMQSAHIQETSSRTGLITQPDAGAVGHAHSTGKGTESLGTGYETTLANSTTLAKANSEAKARSQVKRARHLAKTEGTRIWNEAGA